MGITSVRLQPDIEEGLEAVAERLHRTKSWLINQALKEFIAREREGEVLWQQTLGALESVRTGRVVSAESVHDWLGTWGGPTEQSPPKVSQ